METTGIRLRSILEARVSADNADDASRVYNINAQLTTASGKLTSVTQGVVSGITDTSRLADFGLSTDGSLWLNLYPGAGAEGTAVLGAASAFIEAARRKLADESPLNM